ncbi:MAG: carbon monoxide dehydrogenase subunit [Solirubrobacterales bacterium]|nr:carbon monoxide dehydrogenase subunit [Solirubrobacterales bacterium]
MELTNEFSVAAPIDQVWPVLTDIERIAPCVPGFKLTGAADGEYQGMMKVKVGAVQTSYDCTIRFVELDDANHRAVITASGRELKGQGGVTALITSTLTSDGQSTQASVVTSLDVTGRVAQFGRGILADVSNRLVKQFVKQLEKMLLAPEPAPEAKVNGAGAQHAPPAPARSAEAESEPLDLLAVAGGPLVKRALPAVALLLLMLVSVMGLRSRSRR